MTDKERIRALRIALNEAAKQLRLTGSPGHAGVIENVLENTLPWDRTDAWRDVAGAVIE